MRAGCGIATVQPDDHLPHCKRSSHEGDVNHFGCHPDCVLGTLKKGFVNAGLRLFGLRLERGLLVAESLWGVRHPGPVWAAAPRPVARHAA